MGKNYISTMEAAKILGLSRTAVFYKIQKGELPAEKVGRNFIIDIDDLEKLNGNILRDIDKKIIEASVKKTIDEYGEALKLLGKE